MARLKTRGPHELFARSVQTAPMRIEGKAFGRRTHAGLPRAAPDTQGARPVGQGRRPEQIALGLGVVILFVSGFAVTRWALPQMSALQAEDAQAEQRVTAIVNQPVTHLPRTAQAAVFSPGWFHDGAPVPDFAGVDIRKTQEFPYARYTYVTSDVNPKEMFVGAELEFNAMTQYFYADRALPKKRLSEKEMLEIDRLYRVIGHDRPALTLWWVALSAMLTLVVVLLATPLLFTISRRAGRDIALQR